MFPDFFLIKGTFVGARTDYGCAKEKGHSSELMWGAKGEPEKIFEELMSALPGTTDVSNSFIIMLLVFFLRPLLSLSNNTKQH